MATPPSNPPRKQNAGGLPPRRGRVKAQIFESLAENLASAASKAGQVLAIIKGGGGGGSSSSASTSAAASPPPSEYTSDGYPDQA